MGWLYFLSVLGWALLLVALLKIRIGQALLAAVCGMLFISFYGVIALQAMAPTAYLLMYGGLFWLLAGAAGVITNFRGMRERLSPVPLALYLLFGIACAVLTRNAVVAAHDDMSYWMRIVKELFLFERFPIHGNATMYHSDYIPLLASLQYCVNKVFGWQDAYSLYVTFSVLAVSIVAIAECQKKLTAQLVLAAGLTYAVAALSFDYFSMRADLYMGALFSAGVLCFFSREDSKLSSLIVPLCAAAVLTGFKIYSGLMFAASLCLCMLFAGFAEWRAKRPCKTLFLVAAISLVLCLAMHFAWSILYHYHETMAAYEAALLSDAYLGKTSTLTPPTITLTSLLKGNPRTDMLTSVFSKETVDAVLPLITDTFVRFMDSKLPLVLAALALALVLALTGKEHRGRFLGLLAAVVFAYIVYTLGLFGSYFVQAETAPASNLYLSTCSLPVLMAALFIAVTLLWKKDRLFVPQIVLSLCLAGLLVVLCTPGQWPEYTQVTTEPEDEAYLASDFYENVIYDQLYETDQGKRALVIDCSYEASECTSKSGKTHAYQFYALPMRTIVRQWPYGDYSKMDQATADYVIHTIEENRCDMLILRIDDEVYWYTLMEELQLWGDNDVSIGVYDIVRQEDGTYQFIGRMNE